MFSKGKKKGDGAAASPNDSGAGGVSLAPGTSGSASGSARRQPSGVPSIISADLTIEGNLVSHGDLQIDGTVQGDICSRTLTLGEDGRIEGAIEAETVRLCGEVDGQVKAATVVVTKTAKIRGDIVHDSLAIEAGAFIDGHCRRDAAGTTSVSLLDNKPLAGKPVSPGANGRVSSDSISSGSAGSETKPVI
ncbi:bactofilin family protein [Algihabitans albus]|uniref:bactofilin family protein n=1 Tax=Algihabitans albus TaxID=2164067 RepID=UPI000E5C6A18|nr:polymer-forming cytoskeletal protein [Algihabitans albus]